MAATAVVSPTSMYSGPPPPPYNSWQGQEAGQRSGLISPPDSRRTSDNKNDHPPPHIQTAPPPTQRLSLPSIHEAVGLGPRSNPYKSPISASFPSQSTQLPFSQPPARPYLAEHSSFAPSQPPIYRQPTPPRPVQIQSISYPRNEPQYAEPPRHTPLTSLQPAPGPPPAQYVSQYEPPRHAPDTRYPDPVPNSAGGYRQGPPPHQQIPPTTPFGPSFNHSQYTSRDGRETSDIWKAYTEKNSLPFGVQKVVKRDLDVYQFENGLSEVHKMTHNLSKLANHYLPIARQQQRCVNTVPDGMPNSEECAAYLANAKTLYETMTQLKNMVVEQEQNQLADQRMREAGQRPGAYDDEMSMYGDDMKNHGYGESKKRRGRAAPPGRCHSCNRAETPEWRRGPDGARTLCNACGLHYAKLTRKNNQKQSQGSNGSTSLRPKSMDGPPMQ